MEHSVKEAAQDIEHEIEMIEQEHHVHLDLAEEGHDKDISRITNELNHLSARIMHEKHAQRMLAIDREWASTQQPEFSAEASGLSGALQSLKDQHAQLKLEKSNLQEEYQQQVLEAVKAANPKLFPLMKKLLGLERDRESLRERALEITSLRTHLGHEYKGLSKQLRAEEQCKKDITTLEAQIKEKDEKLTFSKNTYQNMLIQLKELEKQSNERQEENNLLEVHRKWQEKVDDKNLSNNALRERAAELAGQIAEIQTAPQDLNTTDLVRSELRRLEHEIIARTAENKQKTEKRQELKEQLAQLKQKLEMLRLIAKPRSALRTGGNSPRKGVGILINEDNSPTFALQPRGLSVTQSCVSPDKLSVHSPSKSIAQNPFSPSKSRMSTVSRRRRTKVNQEQAKRAKAIQEISDTVSSGKTAGLLDTLKTIGRPGQSLGSKLVELNRAVNS